MASKKRTDKRGRTLFKGELQKKDKRYEYRYVDKGGKKHSVYSWRLTETDPQPKGKQPCKSLREMEKEIQLDLAVGINHAEAKKMTVCDLYAKHNKLNPTAKQSTIKGRNNFMTILQNDELGSMSVDDVKPSDAKSWAQRMKEKGYAYQTIKNHQRSLLAIFYTAIDDDLIRKNPFKWDMKDVIENDTKPKIALKPEQKEKLLSFVRNDCTYSRYYNAIVVLFYTGLRISELCGLTVQDIDFDNGYINIDHQIVFDKGEYRIETPKTDAGNRQVYMFEPTRKALENEIQNRKNVQPITIDGRSDFIFLNLKGYPMYNTAYATVFSAMIKKYNKHHNEQLPKFSPHTLRHTFCTHMADKKAPDTLLQYTVGHASILTTKGYYVHSSVDSAKEEFQSIKI